MPDKKKLPKNSADVYDPPWNNSHSRPQWHRMPKNPRWKCTDCGAEFRGQTDRAKMDAHFERLSGGHSYHGGWQSVPHHKGWYRAGTRVSANTGEEAARDRADLTKEYGYRPHWA
jgi:hypothetical protein